MRAVQPLRLQGPGRPLRGPPVLRRDPRDDSLGIDLDRVETQGDRGGNGQPPLLGLAQDPERDNDSGRGPEGDGPLEAGSRFPVAGFRLNPRPPGTWNLELGTITFPFRPRAAK